MKIGGIVYEFGGEHYFMISPGTTPNTPPRAELVLSLLEDVRGTDEFLTIMRQKANEKGIGHIVSLPDLMD